MKKPVKSPSARETESVAFVAQPQKAPNFRVEMKGARKAKVEIYDQIGPSWAGMIDSKSVSQALNEAGALDEIDVHINSPGGSAFDGLAINNILKAHPAKVRVHIDGVAASAASLIAMAGDSITMPKNALMMIHEAATFAYGMKSDLTKAADMLDKTNAAAVATYADKTKKPSEEIAKLMADETWFTGDEAVAAGFADRTTAEVSLVAAGPVSDAFSMFRRAPQNLSALVALSMKAPEPEKKDMPDTQTPEMIAAEAAKAELAKAEAKAAADKIAKDSKDAVDAERNRGAEINSLCLQAGKPELAAKFIGDGATIADVQAHLLKVLCQDRKPVDDGGEGGSQTTDENAAYKAEYAKNKAEYAKAGMTEEQFVSMRRIDDGKDTLVK